MKLYIYIYNIRRIPSDRCHCRNVSDVGVERVSKYYAEKTRQINSKTQREVAAAALYARIPVFSSSVKRPVSKIGVRESSFRRFRPNLYACTFLANARLVPGRRRISIGPR